MDKVAHDVRKLISKSGGDDTGGDLIQLAYQCASTFRATDYQGGCNGARIRYSPGKDWPDNAGLVDRTIPVLEPIKKKYGKGLSFADLIVLAGNVAVEETTGIAKLPFCPGRVDAEDGSGWKDIEYGITESPTSVDQIIERYERRGQSARDFVALSFAWIKSSENLLNALQSDEVGDDVYLKGWKFYPELRHWAEYYAFSGDSAFGHDFAQSWTRLMNADRFLGPVGNVCGST